MPTDTQPSPADQLADLLDGKVGIDDVSPEVARLGELAGQLRTHLALVPPTDAFREALRDQLVQSAAAPTTSAASVAATSTSSAATGGGGLSALVAGITATAVLATGTLTVADRAGPGDLLAGLDRGIERAQLALTGDERDVELLVDFATERVLEALQLADTATVSAALADAEDLVDQALALAVSQGRAVGDLLEPYTGALLTLASRTDDPVVRAQVEQRLGSLGLEGGPTAEGGDAPLAPTPGGAAEDGGGATQDQAPADDTGSAGSDDLDESSDDVEEGVGDLIDELPDDLTDPIDDVTDPVDDLTDPLDDVTDPLDDAVDDAVDAVEDAVGGLTGPGD